MLTLTNAVLHEITEWAKQHPDIEVTGFIARGPEGLRVQPMQNIHPNPHAYYEWSPGEMMERWAHMDACAEEPLVYYHSHPRGLPSPSEEDMRGALTAGIYHLIVYPCRDDMGGADCWHVSAWECVTPGILVKVELETTA